MTDIDKQELKDVEITSINLEQMMAICEAGKTHKITDLIDADGENTDEKSEAIVAIIALEYGGFTVIETKDFEEVLNQ